MMSLASEQGARRPADPVVPSGSLLAELRRRARGEPITSRARTRPPASAAATAPQFAARQRELGQHGRRTVRKLLEAGLAELADKGYQSLRVDDVTQRAGISHGTFYLYFASKEDMFSALVGEVLQDMRMIAGDFPVVTPDSRGRAALRDWVERFGRLYMAHATIIRILSQAEVVGEAIWADGMRVLFGLGQAIAQGMTAAARSRQAVGGSGDPSPQRDDLTALACLTLLERVNYLFAMGVRLPRAEMTARLSDIIHAAFREAP
jgi:AcrR family transcriptional regulator